MGTCPHGMRIYPEKWLYLENGLIKSCMWTETKHGTRQGPREDHEAFLPS